MDEITEGEFMAHEDVVDVAMGGKGGHTETVVIKAGTLIKIVKQNEAGGASIFIGLCPSLKLIVLDMTTLRRLVQSLTKVHDAASHSTTQVVSSGPGPVATESKDEGRVSQRPTAKPSDLMNEVQDGGEKGAVAPAKAIVGVDGTYIDEEVELVPSAAASDGGAVEGAASGGRSARVEKTKDPPGRYVGSQGQRDESQNVRGDAKRAAQENEIKCYECRGLAMVKMGCTRCEKLKVKMVKTLL